MIYSTLTRPPTVWSQQPPGMKVLLILLLGLLYNGIPLLFWLAYATGYIGLLFPLLLTMSVIGGNILIFSMLLERRFICGK